MKTKIFVTLFSILALNTSYACLTEGKLTVCPGDTAIVGDADGKVIGTNPASRKVSIDFSQGRSRYSGINTFDIARITVNKGCIHNLCVGDMAIKDDADGKILGVNPVTQKVSVDFSQGKSRYSGISTYDALALTGKGCVMGFCVNDKAVVNDGDGIIVGVSKLTRKVSIDFSRGQSRYSGISTFDIGRVTIGKGCFMGICVGDTAIYQDADGLIIGINPITRKVSINYSKGRSRYSGIGTVNIDSITVNSYCTQYDENSNVRRTDDTSNFEINFSIRIR